METVEPLEPVETRDLSEVSELVEDEACNASVRETEVVVVSVVGIGGVIDEDGISFSSIIGFLAK